MIADKGTNFASAKRASCSTRKNSVLSMLEGNVKTAQKVAALQKTRKGGKK